jgi:hypothetical protein
MNSAGSRDRNLLALEYLQLLRSLAGELEKAMKAIANNALPELEESVVRQQEMSVQLNVLVSDLCVPLRADHSSPQVGIEENAVHEIRAASNTLQILNQRYAALLQHSSRSVAMMVSLFTSVSGRFQEASGPRLKYQTWSCRM